MMKDKCICYIGMATRLALLRVHWQLYLRNMYPWHIYTNFYFYIYIYMYISTSAPIFTKTTHLIWKYCTSWFSSFTIYYKLCCWYIKVIMSYGILSNFPLVVRESLNHKKFWLRGHIFQVWHILIVKIIGYVCLWVCSRLLLTILSAAKLKESVCQCRIHGCTTIGPDRSFSNH